MKATLLVLLGLGFGLLSGCASNVYDDDPLLKPPQVVAVDSEKKS